MAAVVLYDLRPDYVDYLIACKARSCDDSGVQRYCELLTRYRAAEERGTLAFRKKPVPG